MWGFPEEYKILCHRKIRDRGRGLEISKFTGFNEGSEAEYYWGIHLEALEHVSRVIILELYFRYVNQYIRAGG